MISPNSGLAICVVGVLLLLAVRSDAQGRFRVTHGSGVRQDSSLRIDGQVFNDGDRDAFDVWVTAEARDAAGKVVARGITFVSPLIAGRRSAAFAAKVPLVDGVQSFHVAVSAYRDGVMQSP